MKSFRETSLDGVGSRILGPEAQRNHARRVREGFIDKYLSGKRILDIGYRGGQPDAVPIVDHAIGVELDYPGYDGKTLPFGDDTQDAVFVSHCLEHILDYESAVSDWYRVLRPGGYLIIAVPHRDLYERKGDLPSRFNRDHKRFYTPALLLAQIEEVLPVGGYRIRSLRDIDDNFDYATPPNQHARGCYEIELVIEKIKTPAYATLLRSPATSADVLTLCASLVAKAIHARRCKKLQTIMEVEALLRLVQLPPFAALRDTVLKEHANGSGASITIDEIKDVIQPLLRTLPFDEGRYIAENPDVSAALARGEIKSAYEHFIAHGYFEGRHPDLV
jgi:SAM-dependent methyltransferase